MNRKLGLVAATVGAVGIGAAACGGTEAALHQGSSANQPPASSQAPAQGGHQQASGAQPMSQGSVSADERALLARDGYVYSASKTAGAASGSFNWQGTPGGGRVNPANGTVEHAMPLGGSNEVVGVSAAGYETVISPSFSEPGAKTVHFDGRTFTVKDISKQQATAQAAAQDAVQVPAPRQAPSGSGEVR